MTARPRDVSDEEVPLAMAAAIKSMLLTLCVTGLTSLGSNAAAIDSISLKPDAYVKGPTVTLGEVAEITGDDAETCGAVQLVPAAPPSEVRRIEKFLVEARLKAAGIPAASFELRGASAVMARTLHTELKKETLEENLRAYIEHEMPWKAEDAVVEINGIPDALVVAEGEIGYEWKCDPGFRFLGTGGIRGAVTVDGQVKRSFLCKVSIEAYDNVVVATSPIERGNGMNARNVTLERRAISSIREAVFHDLAELDGMVARRSIASGELITQRSLVAQIVIRRNQLVTVETRAGGLQVETQARAGADGAIGDVIVCVNPNSNQPFQGVVRRDGVVVVE